jgi:hypothetical protein
MREKLQVRTENLETFGREVITEERRCKIAALLRALLFTLSKLYQILVKIHRWLIND